MMELPGFSSPHINVLNIDVGDFPSNFHSELEEPVDLIQRVDSEDEMIDVEYVDMIETVSDLSEESMKDSIPFQLSSVGGDLELGNFTIDHVLGVDRGREDSHSPTLVITMQDSPSPEEDTAELMLQAGIEATDVTSLLKQFEESEATITGEDSSKKERLTKPQKNLRDLDPVEVAKKIGPAKRKSTILIEADAAPPTRKGRSKHSSIHRVQSDASFPIRSLPSSRSASPVVDGEPGEQLEYLGLEHDYCVNWDNNNVIQPAAGSPLFLKHLAALGGKLTPQQRRDFYRTRYKVRKKDGSACSTPPLIRSPEGSSPTSPAVNDKGVKGETPEEPEEALFDKIPAYFVGGTQPSIASSNKVAEDPPEEPDKGPLFDKIPDYFAGKLLMGMYKERGADVEGSATNTEGEKEKGPEGPKGHQETQMDEIDRGTEWPKNKEGPEDNFTAGLKDKGTEGPKDNVTEGPKDKGTGGPKDGQESQNTSQEGDGDGASVQEEQDIKPVIWRKSARKHHRKTRYRKRRSRSQSCKADSQGQSPRPGHSLRSGRSRSRSLSSSGSSCSRSSCSQACSRSGSPSVSPSRSPSRLRSRSHRRSRSGIRSRSLSRMHSRSPSRMRSRSRSVSRMPPSKSNSKMRSRSPSRTHSRSPSRMHSRSPSRRHLRSPSRMHSRSPSRRHSRSPSRSPSGMHARSPSRIHSRSHSRSPSRMHSRSPSRMRSRSPSRMASRTPSRSPPRMHSKSSPSLHNYNSARRLNSRSRSRSAGSSRDNSKTATRARSSSTGSRGQKSPTPSRYARSPRTSDPRTRSPHSRSRSPHSRSRSPHSRPWIEFRSARRSHSSGSRSRDPADAPRQIPRSGSYNRRSRSRSRDRSRSPCRLRNQQQRLLDRRKRDREEELLNQLKEEEKVEEWEDRRVIYVGNITEGTTRDQLYRRFSRFGEIKKITLHFRDEYSNGDHYAFITFEYTCDAFACIKAGNPPDGAQYELCFGGRRNFCKAKYQDLDSMNNEEERHDYGHGDGGSNQVENDFDKLLREAMKKVKR